MSDEMSMQTALLLSSLILVAIHTLVSLGMAIASSIVKQTVQTWMWCVSLLVCVVLVGLLGKAYQNSYNKDHNKN